MPLSLPAMNVAIVCEGRELETFDVKQNGTTSLTAFIASEAGKVSISLSSDCEHRGTNHVAFQQFKITFSNNLPNFEVVIFLHVDGRLVQSMCLQAWSSSEILGPYSNVHSILPFKFQELQLVGEFSTFRLLSISLTRAEDPDFEDAPAAPEMGTIELKAYRCRTRYFREPSKRLLYEDLHRGRVSERSKKAGWHHITYVPSFVAFLPAITEAVTYSFRTGDEIPVNFRPHEVEVDYLDPWAGPPCASVKIFYRPRGIKSDIIS
jgi:hypothetical protein